MKKLPYEVYKAGQQCENNKYTWHKIDGYCQCCKPESFSETNEQVQDRRSSKGYR